MMTISSREKRLRYWKSIRKYAPLYLLMLPGIVYFIIFKYLPMYGVTIAFKDFKINLGITGSPWVGLKYFERLFMGKSFLEVIRNTVVINFYYLLFGFPAAIILALVVNEIKCRRYQKVVQTITYMPHFISWVVIYGLFVQLLSPSTGPVNLLIKAFGGTPIYFLGDSRWFRMVMVFTYIWKTIGWSSIIYLAALTGIDTQLYEAATIDGATRFQRIVYITLPGIKSIIVTMFILRTGDLMADNFEQIYNFLNDNTLAVGDVISTYVYRNGITKMKYSTGTAVELFTTVISFLLVIVSNTVANKVGEQGIW